MISSFSASPTIEHTHFIERRNHLRQQVDGNILLLGNTQKARNFPANHLPFRQDSSFWYYTGCTIPNAAWFTSDTEDILFLPAQESDDVLWHGEQESNDTITKRLGFNRWLPRESLDQFIQKQDIEKIHSIAIANTESNHWLSNMLGTPFCFGKTNGSDTLIDAIITQRRILSHQELEQLRWTAQVTKNAHTSAMQATRIGGHEREVAAAFHYPIHRAGLSTAYHSIVTVDGEVLHNHAYRNPLQDGDLLLLDGGAESPFGYATDVTRTWPVSGRFSDQQRRAYTAVLEAQQVSINMVRPGVRYRDIHMATCQVLAEFLVEEGLLKGKPTYLVEQGVHALFFPHGVGHLLGLDVHDMENFGDRVAYAEGRTRSTQFGTAYLRMDLDLESNMVVTIEPGFYVCPAIFQNKTLRERFQQQVDWEVLETWMDFGGIRIEDDIRCTEDEPENLTADIPKSIADLENIIGQSA